MELKLRKTVIGGDTLDDDYQVIWDGIPIGRILQQPGVPAGRPNWSWGVSFPHRPQPPSHRGLCSDIEECKRRVKVVWGGIEPTLTETDIRKAREQTEDNRKRWKT
jgi:hypothetical protein